MSPPGLIFWGLFPAFALLVVGYVVWMVRCERREARSQGQPTRAEDP